MSSGSGAGGAERGWPSTAGSSASMTDMLYPSSRDRRPAVVIAATGAASAIMNSIRVSGSAGSIAKYVAPDLSTASIVATACADRSNNSATHEPGPTPSAVNRCANRLAASSSSR
ncbi:hypothetical protein GCM10023161_45080 [Mycobacterium paraffinicum]|uniref:Uncharacterized protein n=1 Tax=Mycobacterium paraffinicum TaxID=53378 RepID=A0ABP8F525_9MYCO